MKRNALLVGLLGILLWFTWHEKHREEMVLGVFGEIVWEEVTAMTIPGVSLKKTGAKWVVSQTGHPVDEEKVREIWSALTMIGTQREITHQDVLRTVAFPPSSERLTIEHAGGHLEILLGSKLRFDQGFYLETVITRGDRAITRRWVAQDRSAEPGLYNVKTVHRSSAKYQRLKSLLQLTADDFYPEERS